MAGGYATAQARHYAAWEGDLSSISPDALILLMALPAVIFAVVFGIGHTTLRHLGAQARLAYSAPGAIALLIASGATAPTILVDTALANGVLSVFVALTAVFGGLVGFLHVRSAGREYDEDESEQVELAFKRHPQSKNAAVDLETGELGKIETQNETFFEGPLQVITSGHAMFAAAFAGAFAHFFYSLLVGLVFSGSLGNSDGRVVEQVMAEGFFTHFVFSLLVSIMICLVVLTPSIFGVHKLLASRERIDMGSYVIAGALAPLGVGLAMLWVGILFTHWLILPLAVAMGTYRHLAGLEPADLPEDIEVNDRRTLVGSDHVRRRVRRVVN